MIEANSGYCILCAAVAGVSALNFSETLHSWHLHVEPFSQCCFQQEHALLERLICHVGNWIIEVKILIVRVPPWDLVVMDPNFGSSFIIAVPALNSVKEWRFDRHCQRLWPASALFDWKHGDQMKSQRCRDVLVLELQDWQPCPPKFPSKKFMKAGQKNKAKRRKQHPNSPLLPQV